MHLAYLLSHSMMRPVKNGPAEDDNVARLKILGGHRWNRDLHLLAIAHNEGVQRVVVVHNVELRDARDKLAIERQDQVAFPQSLLVPAGHLAHHEELVALGTLLLNHPDPA